MSDNFVANAGSGGSTFAADDIGPGVLYPRVKETWGPDGTANDTNLTTPLPVQVVNVGNGGATLFQVLSAASTNATSVKASAGVLMSLYVSNINAAVRYLKFYNKASSPTVGTDTVVWTIPIPGNTAGAGVVVQCPPGGIKFTTGIALAITTGVASSDTGAVAANDIVVAGSYV